MRLIVKLNSLQEQVQSNKDLDLPTQQELLAQFRCDEISSAALADFNEQSKSQRRPIEAGHVVEGLGKMMRLWKTEAVCSFLFTLNYINKKANWFLQQDMTETPLDITRVFTTVNALTFWE